jgi:Uma2 family endonuclease
MRERGALKRAAIYRDLEALPEHLVGEIIDGDLYASPRPAIPHAIAAARLDRSLGGPFDSGLGGPGGWWILVEPELHFGNDVVVPDLAGWRRTRLPDMPRDAFLTVAPDWACEIVSPSTERLDRGKKLALYARERASHVWIVNPLAETIEAYRLEQERWLLVETFVGDATARIEPFDAIELELWRIWGRSEPQSG